jgi:hypothetical protein
LNLSIKGVIAGGVEATITYPTGTKLMIIYVLKLNNNFRVCQNSAPIAIQGFKVKLEYGSVKRKSK